MSIPKTQPAVGRLPAHDRQRRVPRAGSARAIEHPEPIVAGQVDEYAVDLHWIDHRFAKGHKIMVQIQSTWFPLIDRNPQKFVPNIFEAKASDYQIASQRVHRLAGTATHLELSIMPAAIGTTKN